MSPVRQYVISGQVFATQRELESRVREIIRTCPLDTVFEHDFLAAVVNELHPEVRSAGQAVRAFRYLTYSTQLREGWPQAAWYRGGKIMTGWFEPASRWEDVTVYPWKRATPEADVREALRSVISARLPKPGPDDCCAWPDGCTARGYELQYDHVHPVFQDIATACLRFMTPGEITARFGYSKFDPARRTVEECIPADHQAVQLLLAIHAHPQQAWQWLCPPHHKTKTAQERKARP